MAAKIITIVNQKGGSGKTTLTMQLGGTLSKWGLKTLIMDADPQGTATRWATAADETTPFPAQVVGMGAAGGKIHQEIRKFIDDYDVILVDCPPAVESDVPQSALLVSDLAAIPVIPSPADLWATVGIKKLIDMVLPLNESLKSLLVVNMLQANTILAKEAAEALAEFDIPVAKSSLCQRNAFRKSSAFGQTVQFLGREEQKAIDEVENLAKEITSIIGITKPRGGRKYA